MESNMEKKLIVRGNIINQKPPCFRGLLNFAYGGMQVVAPMANSNGYRQVPQLGNLDHGLFAILKNLPPGTYYWSVQAIDTDFAGSPFASENSFTIWRVFLPVALSVQ
jgi:hypothetical protein